MLGYVRSTSRDPVVTATDIVGGSSLALLASSGSLKGTLAFSWFPIDLTLLSVVLVAIVVYLRILTGSLIRLPFMLIATPFGLWCILALPLFRGAGGFADNGKAVILFTVTFACAIGALAVFCSERAMLVFFATLLLIGVFAGLDTLLGERSYANEYSTRLTLEGATTITAARMLVGGSLVCFVAMFVPWRRPGRLLFAVGFIALLLVALMTGSRGPVMSAVLAVSVTLLAAGYFRRRRMQGLLVSIAMLLIVVFAAIRTGGDGVGRVLDFLSGKDDGGGSGRDELYGFAMQELASNPLGSGWGSFRYHGLTYPHNLFLEVGVEGGVFVLIVVVVFVGYTCWVALRVSDSPLGSLSALMLLYSLFNAMLSSDINGNRLMWMMIFGVLTLYGLRWAEGRSDLGNVAPSVDSRPKG